MTSDRLSLGDPECEEEAGRSAADEGPPRPPAGCCNAAFLAFLLLGTATLFPWNALITAADYWEMRFPGKHVDRLFTIAYLPVNLLVLLAMIRWHAAICPRLRILSGLSGFTLAMLAAPSYSLAGYLPLLLLVLAVPLVDLAGPSPLALAALLLLVAGVGACDGVAQGALFGEAAPLPPLFTQALVSGTSLSGVAVSLLRIATKATLPDTERGMRASANLYFLLAAAVCAASTVVYLMLHRLPGVAAHRAAAVAAAVAGGAEISGAELAADVAEEERRAARGPPDWQLEHGSSPKQRQQVPRPTSIDVELSYEDHMHGSFLEANMPANNSDSPQQQWQHQQRQRPGQQGEDGAAHLSASAHEALLPYRPPSHAASPSSGPAKGGAGLSFAARGCWRRSEALAEVLEAAAPIWRLIAANAGIYIITLSIFPGVLAEDVKSAELGSWYPVALIALFNLADCIGKSLPAADSLRLRAQRQLLAAAAARVVFIPAFHLAASRGAGAAATGTLTLLLGLSNGFLTSCAMIAAPEGLRGRRAALVGNLMVLALVAGLCVGAACGFLWLL